MCLSASGQRFVCIGECVRVNKYNDANWWRAAAARLTSLSRLRNVARDGAPKRPSSVLQSSLAPVIATNTSYHLDNSAY